MKVKYHKRFVKRFKKLIERDRQKIINVINVFIDNPNNPILQNHALKGVLLGKRSISAGPDIRVIFEEYEDCTLVIFIDLGNHNQLYK